MCFLLFLVPWVGLWSVMIVTLPDFILLVVFFVCFLFFFVFCFFCFVFTLKKQKIAKREVA